MRALHDSTDNTDGAFSDISSHVNCFVTNAPGVQQRKTQPTGFKGRDAGLFVAFDLDAFVASICLRPTRRYQ